MESRSLTIMLTDIVGFTERTSQMSREGFMDLISLHDRLVRPIIRHDRGRIVKSLGDSFMSVFESPTNAVLCAISVQHLLREYNQSQPDEDQLHIRISLNAGDVQVKRDGDVFGEPVNVASRLEEVTEKDEIYFTEQVYLTINRNEVPRTLLVQKYRFRGVENEIKVYKVLQSHEDEVYHKIVSSKTQTVLFERSGRAMSIMDKSRKLTRSIYEKSLNIVKQGATLLSGKAKSAKKKTKLQPSQKMSSSSAAWRY